jgi:glutamyl-tRNA reductase
LKHLRIIAFTHKNLDLEKIGFLHIDDTNQKERLSEIKQALKIDEILFLSTCNRIEFILVSNNYSEDFIPVFIHSLYSSFSKEQVQEFASAVLMYDGMDAVEHFLRVSTSIDSMVVGEREIITQVRTAYDNCHKMGLTGDFIRILIRNNIETAKKVYTETAISTKPVSVVSLAYHRLKELNIALDARVLIVGAGATNTNMSRFLKKHGFTNFAVFNRTLSKAQKLADSIGGTAYSLEEIQSYTKGFDVIITCTGAEGHIITRDLYVQLLQDEKGKKIVIDIAVPNDLDPAIVDEFGVKYISVEYLRKISAENQKERAKEVAHVEKILFEELNHFVSQHRMRQVEIAMREVPEKVKEIRHHALENIFAEDLAAMDPKSRETLEKIVGFIEKKYISIPMKMAKDILVESAHKN